MQSSADFTQPDTLVGLRAIGEPLGLNDHRSVRRYIRDEGLPAVKFGRQWISRVGLLNEWIDARATGHL